MKAKNLLIVVVTFLFGFLGMFLGKSLFYFIHKNENPVKINPMVCEAYHKGNICGSDYDVYIMVVKDYGAATCTCVIQQ